MTGTPHEGRTGSCFYCQHRLAMFCWATSMVPTICRDGPRSDDVEERQSGRHRSRADDRRGGSREDYRDNRSHRDSDRRGDRPRSRELATSISARLGDKPADRSLSTKPAEAAAVTEAPRERPSLKAGPAGGAYIPPFRLQQVRHDSLLIVLLQGNVQP